MNVTANGMFETKTCFGKCCAVVVLTMTQSPRFALLCFACGDVIFKSRTCFEQTQEVSSRFMTHFVRRAKGNAF